MPQYRRPAAVKVTSRKRGESTSVHGMESVHETESDHHIAREDGTDSFVRATNLDAPPPRPGMKQRWVRWRTGNVVDSKNLARKRREGWNVRPPESVPEQFRPETSIVSGLGNAISADDMVLMEIPLSVAAKREAFYKNKTARQMQAVDENLMRTEKQGGSPIMRHRKSEVSYGPKRARIVDPD
jgi:hypothetical protein